MKTSSFETYRKQINQQIKSNSSFKKEHQQNSDTLKGVLLNNYIKKQDEKDDFSNFDEISRNLLIFEEPKKNDTNSNKEEIFNAKNALKPILITAGAGLLSLVGISFAIKKYSFVMANKNDIVRPGDLARNINILEEPHFAMYRALREPSAKNILGLIGVLLMSGVTLVSKNLIDGVKEVWIKKQNCDIEHDFQENLIEVEKDAFSGKLSIVNNLLSDTSKYFQASLSNNDIKFKGKNKEKKNSKLKKEIILGILGITGITGIALGIFKNYQKTIKNLDTFVQKYEDSEIKNKISSIFQMEDKSSAIKNMIDILKVINAKDETIKDNLSKIKGITPDEILKATKEIKASQIYAQAPEAMGGISEKIQYYCYINEERGHLYNWILNPENKFNKYLFLSFCLISSMSYIAKSAAQAVKDVTVNRENSKSELNLRKRLVDVEINNFKAKKLSAINPLIDNFNYQLNKGKPKEELKELAENILIEIKNGPPYVYA